MKIKTKLFLGLGLLFMLIIIIASMSIFYINALKKDTNNILVANYNTLEYARTMFISLDKLENSKVALLEFQASLNRQKKNVTEPGELQITNSITQKLTVLHQYPDSTEMVSKIRKDITQLMHINMNAIERKSKVANETAESAIIRISITATFCFITAFILLVNLPGIIANPIRELTESIKEIANQNYKERVRFDSSTEFHQLSQSFNTMAEKLEEYSESKLDKIIKGKKRIETLINNMQDPVIGLDENKIVLFVNNEAFKITGLTAENIIGRHIQEVALNNDLIRDLVRNTAASTLIKENKTLKIYANNKESYFEKEIIDINIKPTGESDLQFIGQVIMLKNITLFKELDVAKTNFIATVSHEFKTPLASIQMSTALLKNEKIGNLNEEQDHLIDSINDDSNRLLKITGELLNMTQLESGSIQLMIASVDPLKIVHSAIDATKNQAEQKNIVISTNFPSENGLVRADFEKMVWVLTNVLSNAIRYSYEHSSILIQVKSQDKEVLISIQDYGQGIPAQYLVKIFNRYFRVPGSKKEGTGLGLAISKEFIESQGGTISVESELAAGSKFTIALKKA
ncbi:ATP-binding protein [Flavobacterium sp. SM2513]|uniref:HAMP domain-containing sensor histidine kinase n=1 Tax=Flavobacterium sp. SM2513 TaxID=3424766 RepID=UPI003D7F9CC4